MAITAGINGRLNIGYQWNSVSVARSQTTEVGTTHTIYQLQGSGVWGDVFLDPDHTVQVWVNNVEKTTGFTVYHAGGVIVFDTSQGVGADVEVSGYQIPMTEIGIAKSFSFDTTYANEDVTTFPTGLTSSYWGKNALTMKNATGTVEVLFDSAHADEWYDAMFGDGVCDPGLMLGVQMGDLTSWDLYFLGYLTGLNQQSSATGMATESLSFALAGTPPYFIAH